MKYHLMQPVMIISDTLNYGLPVGSLAYVVMIEPRGFFGTPYFIRVPSEQRNTGRRNATLSLPLTGSPRKVTT